MIPTLRSLISKLVAPDDQGKQSDYLPSNVLNHYLL